MIKYRFEFMSMTQIGELFGVSSKQVGKWLVSIGLRTTENRPSRKSFDGGFVKEGPSRNQGYNWVWNSEMTVAAIESAGHRRVFPAPLGLVTPAVLIGPLTLKSGPDGNFQIENRDGEPVLLGQGESNGAVLLRVLEAADRHAVFQRTFEPKPG